MGFGGGFVRLQTDAPFYNIEDTALFEQLTSTLERVFINLRGAKLTLNPNKCRFGCEEVTFMGSLIRKGTVSPTEDKTLAIEQFPTTENATQVRQFLGVSGFFRAVSYRSTPSLAHR